MNHKFIVHSPRKSKEHRLLFLEVWYMDKKRLFVVDSGSDASYLFFRPLDIRVLDTVKKAVATTMADVEPGTGIDLVLWNHDTYLMPEEKPDVIKELEKQYQMDVSGLVGLDWLIKNKIVLDFGQL